MRYTFPQTVEDLQTVTRLVVQRQTWRRPLVVALVLFAVVMMLYPLFGDHPPSLRFLILNGAPWFFIILLWMALLFGYSSWMSVIAVLLGLAVLLAIAVLSRPTSVADIIGYLLPYALMVGIVPLAPYLMARRYRTNALYQGDMTVELGPDELRVVRAVSTMTFRWSGIARAAETPGYFLIFIIKANAFYIPKRVVPPGELDDLRAFLRAHVPSGLL